MSTDKSSKSIPEPEPSRAVPEVATVDHMIEWLRWDGWYRGIVGWHTGYSNEEIFGLHEHDANPNSGFARLSRLDTWIPLRCDFDLNAVSRRASFMEQHENYIRAMIRSHYQLLPAAVKEIDHRLEQAGLSSQDKMKDDNAPIPVSTVYEKLQRLEENQRKHLPEPTVHVQIIYHAGGADTGYEPATLNLYIPKTCLLEDFEDILRRHLPHKQIRQNMLANSNEIQVSEPIWKYRIIPQGDRIRSLTDDIWTPLRNQEDFTVLMKVIVRDDSKLGVICHEMDLHQRRSLTAPTQWEGVTGHDMWKALRLDEGKRWNEDDQIKWGEDDFDDLMHTVETLPDEFFLKCKQSSPST